MKKLMVVVLAVVAAGAAAWWLLRGTRVQVEWCPAWPESVRAVGEASETILAGPDGKVTPADRERARERARWKAWYFAQLRLAEQLGGLRIQGSTTVRDLQLVDQELKASYEGVISAAHEVEKESRVEVLKDAVSARVVVEARPERVVSFREALVAALKSGKVRVERAAAAPPKKAAPEPPKAGGASAGLEAAPKAGGAKVAESAASSPAADGAVPEAAAPAAAAARAAAPLTGCVVALADGAGFVGPAPKFLDAEGRSLGSALDLPPDRVLAGVPIASPGDAKTEREVAGPNPLRLDGAIRGGDVVVGVALDEERRAFFAESIRAGKVLLVLGGGAS